MAKKGFFENSCGSKSLRRLAGVSFGAYGMIGNASIVLYEVASKTIYPQLPVLDYENLRFICNNCIMVSAGLIGSTSVNFSFSRKK